MSWELTKTIDLSNLPSGDHVDRVYMCIDGNRLLLGQQGGSRFDLYEKKNGSWELESSFPVYNFRTTFYSGKLLSGDTLVIPRYLTDGVTTEVAVYRRKSGGWEEETVFSKNDPDASYGKLVSLDKNILVLGDTDGIESYRRKSSGWEEMKTISKGGICSVSGNYMAVAPQDGSIYIYKLDRDEWNLVQTITPENETFTWQICLDKNLLVFNTNIAIQINRYAGERIHIYRLGTDGWEKEKVFSTEDADSALGYFVSLSGGYMVTSNGTDFSISSKIEVYDKKSDGWQLTSSIPPPVGKLPFVANISGNYMVQAVLTADGENDGYLIYEKK
jgi:WD40 repeat protein